MSFQLNYPLRFQPILKERIWGGRRLESVLGKQIPPGKQIGESWEISDHGQDLSIIANSPLRGRTLRDVLNESAEELLGDVLAARRSRPGAGALRFPLLVKWLDANENLSIQAHPCDGHPRLPSGESGKTECWLVAQAEAGAEIYLGLRRGIDRAALMHELSRGTIDRCLNVFPARCGDFFFVPAGTPHAIGAGVLLAEIQQTSDTTFRLFDWNRIDPATDRPRELQIEQALDCINFDALPPVTASLSSETASDSITLLKFEQCPHFNVRWRRLTIAGPIGNPGRATVLVCLSGSGRVVGGGETVEFRIGDCVLLPARGLFNCEPAAFVEFLEVQIGS
jgi:mannose-6-phosphate isomerase